MAESSTPDSGPPVRMTVDLTGAEHRGLRDLCSKYADDAGVPRVPARRVARELIAELLANPDLDKRIRARLNLPASGR